MLSRWRRQSLTRRLDWLADWLIKIREYTARRQISTNRTHTHNANEIAKEVCKITYELILLYNIYYYIDRLNSK